MQRPLITYQMLRRASAAPKPAFIPSSLTRLRVNFSSSPAFGVENRVLNSVLIPPTFHDYLRLVSANDTLLLALFTTSGCAPCRTITPLLTELVKTRSSSPDDKFSALALTEVELDSPDTSNGKMMDLGVEWGVSSIPTLIGFGGRRAERVTERLDDTKVMSDKSRITEWVDEAMRQGDPFGTQGGGGGGGLLSRLFG
jgi:thiol-disulfide isomerase/thioredoxin